MSYTFRYFTSSFSYHSHRSKLQLTSWLTCQNIHSSETSVVYGTAKGQEIVMSLLKLLACSCFFDFSCAHVLRSSFVFFSNVQES